jgi:hypothetical protein
MESQLRTFEQAFIRRKPVDSRMLMQVLQIKRNLVLKNGVVPAQLLARLQGGLNDIENELFFFCKKRVFEPHFSIFGHFPLFFLALFKPPRDLLTDLSKNRTHMPCAHSNYLIQIAFTTEPTKLENSKTMFVFKTFKIAELRPTESNQQISFKTSKS